MGLEGVDCFLDDSDAEFWWSSLCERVALVGRLLDSCSYAHTHNP